MMGVCQSLAGEGLVVSTIWVGRRRVWAGLRVARLGGARPDRCLGPPYAGDSNDDWSATAVCGAVIQEVLPWFGRCIIVPLLTRRISSSLAPLAAAQLLTTKAMPNQVISGANILPRSLLDTDFYKARKQHENGSCIGDNTATVFSGSSRCSKPCCIISPTSSAHTSSPTATITYTSLASVTSDFPRAFPVRLPASPHLLLFLYTKGQGSPLYL